MTVKKIPTEHEEQVAVVNWCKANNIIAVSVPNGFHQNQKRDNRFYGMIAKLKKEGYSPGFPDLIIIPKDKSVFFIEMKRIKGSEISKDQKKWSEKLNDFGHRCFTCNGADEAFEVIKMMEV